MQHMRNFLRMAAFLMRFMEIRKDGFENCEVRDSTASNGGFAPCGSCHARAGTNTWLSARGNESFYQQNVTGTGGYKKC